MSAHYIIMHSLVFLVFVLFAAAIFPTREVVIFLYPEVVGRSCKENIIKLDIR